MDCLDCVDGCLGNQCNSTLLGVLQKLRPMYGNPYVEKPNVEDQDVEPPMNRK